MSNSDVDDADIPCFPTARKPGYEPSLEYIQFLDLGGELAKLTSLKDEKVLKAAVKTQRALKISELSSLCLLYTSPSPRDGLLSRMPSSA